MTGIEPITHVDTAAVLDNQPTRGALQAQKTRNTCGGGMIYFRSKKEFVFEIFPTTKELVLFFVASAYSAPFPYGGETPSLKAANCGGGGGGVRPVSYGTTV